MVTETILLVEDNPDDAELALLGFAKNAQDDKSGRRNYRIDVVGTGEEALDYLFNRGRYGHRDASASPDLILLDLKLPGISGLTVLKELRRAQPTQQIPVVILTTSDETSDILDGYNLGVNSYLQKPVDFNAFADLLLQISDHWLKKNGATPDP